MTKPKFDIAQIEANLSAGEPALEAGRAALKEAAARKDKPPALDELRAVMQQAYSKAGGDEASFERRWSQHNGWATVMETERRHWLTLDERKKLEAARALERLRRAM